MRWGGVDATGAKANAGAKNSPQQGRLSLPGSGANVTATAVTPLSPADAKWGADTACEDAELIKITSENDYDAVLLSRHRHCSKLVSPPTEINVSLMRRVGSTTWELYKASTPNIEEVHDWVYGTAVIETDWAAFGPQAKLDKQHQVRARVASFDRASDFPIAGASYSIALRHELACEALGGSSGNSNAACANFALPEITLNLTAGAQSGWASTNVTFNWLPDAESYQEFELTVKTQVAYVVQGTPPSPGELVATLNVDSENGLATHPRLRCDRYLPKGGTRGCVYTQVAAVWVVDAGAFPEIAKHIKDAQTTIADGRSVQSPGVYVPKPGTRAVASSATEGPWNLPLQREMDTSSQNRNRTAACEAAPAPSLINTRLPMSRSPSCPAGASNCSCDEYPMAATVQGAFNFPDATSVRMLNKTQNSAAGSAFSAFGLKERLFDHRVATDDFWVFVNSTVSVTLPEEPGPGPDLPPPLPEQ